MSKLVFFFISNTLISAAIALTSSFSFSFSKSSTLLNFLNSCNIVCTPLAEDGNSLLATTFLRAVIQSCRAEYWVLYSSDDIGGPYVKKEPVQVRKSSESKEKKGKEYRGMCLKGIPFFCEEEACLEKPV